MQMYTDTTYVLPPDQDALLFVTEHATYVSLHVPGFAFDGHGFSIHFATAHLEAVEKLVRALYRTQERERVRALMHQKSTQKSTLIFDPTPEATP